MTKFLRGLMRDERGISALEYAILAAIIIAVVVVGITAFGDDIQSLFGRGSTALDSAVTPTPTTGQ